jgi:hypothetical protein
VNLETVAFQKNIAEREKHALDELIELWKQPVTAVLSILCTHVGEDVGTRIAAPDALKELTKAVAPVIYASRAVLPIGKFAESVAAT